GLTRAVTLTCSNTASCCGTMGRRSDGVLPEPAAKKLACGGWGHVTTRQFAHKIASTASVAHVFDRPISWPVGQLLTGHMRIVTRICAAALIAVVAAGCRSQPASTSNSPARRVRGGEATASIRSEPRSFNRLAARDSSSDLVATLTQAKLVRINK